MERLDGSVVRGALDGTRWRVEGDALVSEREFADFAEAMAFVNRVAAIAEDRNHHPDIAVSWNRVTLRQYTHVAGGITQADVDLARAIEEL